MNGAMAVPPVTTSSCLTEKDLVPDTSQTGQDCKVTKQKNSGNNVDIEQESMNRLQNQLLYQTLAQAVSTAFNQVNIVLR